MSAFGGKADIVTSSRDAHTIVISRLRSGAKIVFGIKSMDAAYDVNQPASRGSSRQCCTVRRRQAR